MACWQIVGVPKNTNLLTVRCPGCRANWLNHWFFSFCASLLKDGEFLLKRIRAGSSCPLGKSILRFYQFGVKMFLQKKSRFFPFERA
jgi:hypothetical protein